MAKTVVITGAGSGLGRAVARRLASDGHTLFLLGRTQAKIAAVAQELGEKARAIACDMADPASVEGAFVEIARSAPKIDVLINNAGIFEPFFIKDATDRQIRAALDTNLAGPIYCCRAAIPLLGRGSHIISVGSETVVVPIAMHALYQTSKAGLERFSKTLGQELAPQGVRVTLIRAGAMMDEHTAWHIDPDIARRFAEENLKLGVDNRKKPISHYNSVAELIPHLLALPDDIHVPEVMVEARRP
jgi:meso-butanediol dehydrogenase/(S,S)-butanediol dehydrogenase/diacetyl reductase